MHSSRERHSWRREIFILIVCNPSQTQMARKSPQIAQKFVNYRKKHLLTHRLRILHNLCLQVRLNAVFGYALTKTIRSGQYLLLFLRLYERQRTSPSTGNAVLVHLDHVSLSHRWLALEMRLVESIIVICRPCIYLWLTLHSLINEAHFSFLSTWLT